MDLKERFRTLKQTLPQNVTLVAVSKTKPVDVIQKAYDTGHRIFGENKVQEMTDKQLQLPEDIEWHMIGHLQRNKVKYIAPFVGLIHSIDSLKLLREVDKQAAKHNRCIPCLLQIKIASEDSKFGMDKATAMDLLGSDEFRDLKHVNVVGLMGMATFTEDEDQIQAEFQYLKGLFDALQPEHPSLQILSMGMSDDYPLAIQCGSTMIRVGSKLFGPRN